MGIKADLDNDGSNAEKPFFLESGPITCRCRRIDCSKSKNGERAVFKMSWIPTEDAMAGKGETPLDFPVFEDELDGNLPKQWKVIKYLLGEPMRGDKGLPKWGGGLITWNGALGADQVITGHADVTIKTTEPNPKKGDGGGYWPAKYKVEDYDPAGTHELAAAEGLAACLEPDPTEAAAAEAQLARGATTNKKQSTARNAK